MVERPAVEPEQRGRRGERGKAVENHRHPRHARGDHRTGERGQRMPAVPRQRGKRIPVPVEQRLRQDGGRPLPAGPCRREAENVEPFLDHGHPVGYRGRAFVRAQDAARVPLHRHLVDAQLRIVVPAKRVEPGPAGPDVVERRLRRGAAIRVPVAEEKRRARPVEPDPATPLPGAGPGGEPVEQAERSVRVGRVRPGRQRVHQLADFVQRRGLCVVHVPSMSRVCSQEVPRYRLPSASRQQSITERRLGPPPRHRL